MQPVQFRVKSYPPLVLVSACGGQVHRGCFNNRICNADLIESIFLSETESILCFLVMIMRLPSPSAKSESAGCLTGTSLREGMKFSNIKLYFG